MKRVLILFSFLMCLPVLVFTQYFTYNPGGLGEQNISSNNSTILIDPGWSNVILYDNGGSSASYSDNQNNVVTFEHSDPSKTLKITSNSFYFEGCCDYFYVYDGPNTSSPILVNKINGTTNFGTVLTNSNTVTIKYTSDGSVTYAGFAITIEENSPISVGSISGTSTACSGAQGSTVSFTLSASGLETPGAGVRILPPTGYEVSLDQSTWYSSATSPTYATLLDVGGNIASTSVYARLTSSASDGASGNIVCTNGSTTKNVATGSGIVSSSTYYVSASGNNSHAGTSSGAPFATIAYAISKIGCSSTTINVAAGSYSEEAIEIPDGTSNVTIDGAGIASTIFTGDGDGRFMHFNNSSNSDNTSNSNNITVSNMKISGYGISSDVGGAVKIEENINTNIIFTNLHFHNNSNSGANEDGGAVFMEDGSGATFTGCNFESNTTGGNGGGIYVYASRQMYFRI